MSVCPTPSVGEQERPFVDREEFIKAFEQAFQNIRGNKYSVLVYYGIGGIGKTGLRKELPQCLEKYNFKYQQQEVIWTTIDLQQEEYRKKNTFLATLKNNLQQKHKIHFPAFEIAHAIYWKKANPEISLRKENYLIFEGDEKLDPFFGIVNQIPYFNLVPKVARLLNGLPKYLREWWTKKGEAELTRLSEKEPTEIEERLPYFWAQDLNRYLENTSQTAVLFIDTYEALWEKERGQGTYNSRDEWIRELISNLPESSLWIICGREELRWKEDDKDWDNYLKQYKLEKLPEEDILDFLNRCGIKEIEIQKVIVKASEGVPYYLDLEAETYTEITKTRSPKPDDFAKTNSKIFDQFMKYLNAPEQETLKVLSTPRFWNKDIFNVLIDTFKTGYSLTAFSELNRFSFVQETERKLQLHPLMRESLQVYQDQGLKKEVHNFMLDFYSNQLKDLDIKVITQNHENALAEAFYHAKEALKTNDLLNWFITASDPFDRAAFWQLIAPMYKEMLQILETELGPEHPSIATTLNNLALLYLHMGDYEQALPLYQRALDIYEKVLGPQHPDVATTLNNLAGFYRHMGDYEQALPLYQRALNIREKVLGPQHPSVAITLNNLALLYDNMGDYEQALPLYQRALNIREKVLGSQHPSVATTLNNLALLYLHMGDYEQALPLYQRALNIREKVLGPQHPDVATTLNSLALLYDNMGDYEQALPLYQRALDIYEKVLGPQHPDVATTLNNLAVLYDNMGDYEQALPLYQRALDIYEKVLGPQHPSVATTLNNLAGFYDNMEDYEQALPLYQRALEIYEKILGPKHPNTIIVRDNFMQSINNMKEKRRI